MSSNASSRNSSSRKVTWGFDTTAQSSTTCNLRQKFMRSCTCNFWNVCYCGLGRGRVCRGACLPWVVKLDVFLLTFLKENVTPLVSTSLCPMEFQHRCAQWKKSFRCPLEKSALGKNFSTPCNKKNSLYTAWGYLERRPYRRVEVEQEAMQKITISFAIAGHKS